MSTSSLQPPWVTARDENRDPLLLPSLVLRVVRGPDRGKEALIADRPLRIGGEPGAGLRLCDPFASAIHAEILPDEGGHLLRDLGSTNGTWLGGVRIREAWLRPGALLHIGSSDLSVSPEGPSARAAPGEATSFGPLHGGSLRMRALFARLAKLAPLALPVLITGETGTGKELVARALHEQGPRAAEPFVAVDCGALPATLIESELFGFDRGAFTSADRSHRGAFERAGRGTLFLDEVGELPLGLQPKLLRALDRREFSRVGGERLIPFQGRVVAATNRQVPRQVNEGTFRADLFYRLAAAEVHLPPLRERREDIPLLVKALLEELPEAGGRTLGADAVARLELGQWPGNVRELRSAVHRLVLLDEESERPDAGASGPIPALPAPPPALLRLPYKEARALVLEAFRAAYARQALAEAGSVSETARRVGVDRGTIHRWLARAPEEEGVAR